MHRIFNKYESNYIGIVAGCQQIVDNFNRSLNMIADKNNMTADEVVLLLYLSEQSGNSTSSELTQALPFSPSKITRITKKLLKKKMISEIINHHDRRSILISITESGEDIARRTEAYIGNIIAKMSEELEEFDSDKLSRILRSIAEVSVGV